MKEKVGLVILTRKNDYFKRTRWETVRHTLESFTEIESEYDFKIFVCGNGKQEFIGDDCPIPEVYQNGKYIERGGWDIQACANDGLKAAEEAECQRTVIIRAGFCVSNLDFMDNKQLTIQSFIDQDSDHKNETLGCDFMYGTTHTLNRIWVNRPFNRTESNIRNLYKNVCNVTGIQYLKTSKKLDHLTLHELDVKLKAGALKIQ